jgi:hypothetical protein
VANQDHPPLPIDIRPIVGPILSVRSVSEGANH